MTSPELEKDQTEPKNNWTGTGKIPVLVHDQSSLFSGTIMENC